MNNEAHWIIEIWNYKELRFCSACQKMVTYEYGYRYCPFCGKKMTGREEVI